MGKPEIIKEYMLWEGRRWNQGGFLLLLYTFWFYYSVFLNMYYVVNLIESNKYILLLAKQSTL